MGRAARLLLYILTGILVLFVSLIGFAARWTLTTWGDLDIDEIIFQLQAPLTGTGNGMIADYIIKGLVPALAVFAVYILVLILVKKSRFKVFTALLCLVITIAAGLAVKGYIWRELDVEEWLAGQKNGSRFIEENYVNTADVKVTFPEKKRNLLYIYLESMETTYADRESGGGFDTNLIPELTALAKENEDFSGGSTELDGGIVFASTNNTTKAIFAHSTGLPLKVDIGSNNMDTQDAFFPISSDWEIFCRRRAIIRFSCSALMRHSEGADCFSKITVILRSWIIAMQRKTNGSQKTTKCSGDMRT